MEEWQRYRINRNLSELIQNTYATTDLLYGLLQKEIISRNEVTQIQCITNPFEQAHTLYGIIEARRDAFDEIIKALQNTNQTGAAQILLQAQKDFVPVARQPSSPVEKPKLSLSEASHDINQPKSGRIEDYAEPQGSFSVETSATGQSRLRNIFRRCINEVLNNLHRLRNNIRQRNINQTEVVRFSRVERSDHAPLTQHHTMYTAKTEFAKISNHSFAKLILVSTIDVNLTKQKIEELFNSPVSVNVEKLLSSKAGNKTIHKFLNIEDKLKTVCVVTSMSLPGEEEASLLKLRRSVKKIWKLLKPADKVSVFVAAQLPFKAVCGIVADLNDTKGIAAKNTMFVEDHFLWTEIDSRYQETLLNRELYDQGRPVSLRDFCRSYHYSNQDQFYERLCQGKFLVDLIKFKKPPVVFRQTIPVPKSGYISRKVRTRYILSHDIFGFTDRDDLLAINQLDRPADFELFLENLSVECISVTEYIGFRNGTGRLSFKNIIVYIESEEEINMLHTAEHKTSVHRVQLIDKQFCWVKTVGKIDFIQKHLHPTSAQPLFNDEELHKKITNTNIFILCDSAGMGKSVLLAKLANDAQMETNYIVFYYTMADFIKAMKAKHDNLAADDTKIWKVLLDVIQNYASEYQINDFLFEQQELSKHKLVIFLDGLDEVEEDSMDFAFHCLNILHQKLHNLQLRISVRPHLLHKLEQCFNTLGYTIEPFDREDQSSFLTRYWANDRIVKRLPINKVRLDLYATYCLNEIEKALSNKEKDIAGVPLQCLLIAEAFEDVADICANPDVSSVNMHSLGIHSLDDLYEKMIQKKFSVYQSRYLAPNFTLCTDSMEHLHSYYAINTLYAGTKWPSVLRRFHLTANVYRAIKDILTDWSISFDEFKNGSVPFHELLKIGILENRSVDLKTLELQFLHRTFAEFLVAKFSVHEIIRANSDSKDSMEFISEAVLETFQPNVGAVPGMYKFAHPVRCQFINIILRSKRILKFTSQKLVWNSKNWKAIAWASAHENCIEIFKLLENQLHEASIEEQHALFELIDTVDLTYFLKRPKFSAALLHVAVERGDIDMAKLLLTYPDMCERLQKGTELLSVIRASITNSTHLGPSIIEAKVNILKNLITDAIAPNALPIFETNIHVDILLFLIEQVIPQGLFEMTDGEHKTILHKPAEYLSVSDYEKYVACLESRKYGRLVKKLSVCRDLFGQTPLHSIVRHMEPTQHLLNTLSGLKDNQADDTGYNITRVGLRYQKSVECISNLMEFSVAQNYEQIDRFGRTLLHVAAQHYTNEKLDELLESRPEICTYINQPDNYGNTPVFYALENLSPISAISSLRSHGAKLVHQNQSRMTLLHVAAEMGNIKIVELLARLSPVDLFLKDVHDNTPMHFVFHSSVGDTLEIFHNFLEKYPQSIISRNNYNQCPLLYGLTRKHPDVSLDVLVEYITKTPGWSDDLFMQTTLYLDNLRLNNKNVNLEQIESILQRVSSKKQCK